MRTILIAVMLGTVLPTVGFAQPSQQWARQFGTPSNDEAWSVTSDCWGNVFVAGAVHGQLVRPVEGITDCYLSKYDSAGTLLWVRQWGTSGEDRAWEVVVDQCGTAWVVTENAGWGDPEGDAFLTSFTSNGTHRGTWSVGRVTGKFSRTVSLSLAPNFRVLVARNAPSKKESFITAFDMAGCQCWSQRYQYDDEYRLGDITTDRCGNIYVALGRNRLGFFGNVSRLDGCGREIWTRSFGENSSASSVAVDGRGHIWVGGAHLSSSQDAKIAEYLPDGTMLWSKIASGSGLTEVASLVVGHDCAFSTGLFRNQRGDDQYVARFDANRLAWSTQIGTHCSSSGVIGMDGGGHLLVSGVVRGTLSGQQPVGLNDAFVIRYARQ
ncbi:MAG: hypothetical protein H6822_19515 [Planctomycetaceae bacterium]|nr:hypothetical protein [Planctomycetales bacterium]MCB9924376.1 hypothetical protein [Planctomycetaceae bacterium]